MVKWSMVRSMVNGQWSMVNGQWSMVKKASNIIVHSKFYYPGFYLIDFFISFSQYYYARISKTGAIFTIHHSLFTSSPFTTLSSKDLIQLIFLKLHISWFAGRCDIGLVTNKKIRHQILHFFFS